MSKKEQSVLVVEDNEDLVNLIRINLEEEGYTVLVAMDGNTALDIYIIVMIHR